MALCFAADDFISLKHGSNTNLLVNTSRSLVHPDNLSGGLDENFRTSSADFGRKGHLEIQLGTIAEIIVDHEVEAPVGDITSLADPGGGLFINGGTKHYG